MEDNEKPSFENFLSKPTTLSDHLLWQFGSLHVKEDVYRAAELVIGNLNEDGYLTATEDELLGLMEYGHGAVARRRPAETGPSACDPGAQLRQPHGNGYHRRVVEGCAGGKTRAESDAGFLAAGVGCQARRGRRWCRRAPNLHGCLSAATRCARPLTLSKQLDPIGVGARDLRECLLAQLRHLKTHQRKNGNGNHLAETEALEDAIIMVDDHLPELQNKNYKEVAKAMGRPLEAVMGAMDFIRTLDPRPGLRYNKIETRLIEPDVAFVKQGDEYHHRNE